VQALVVTPGEAHSSRVTDVPEPRAREGEVLLRALEVGVCGTDREISEGLFGEPEEEGRPLILGHELLARVERDGHGFARGDLVTATVRRPCGHCLACDEGSPDACLTGDYAERGITRLDGFASERLTESPDNLVAIPRELGRLGVLTEPSSVCARGIRHARAVGGRQPWAPSRALVLGTGAIGVLSAYFLRLDGFDVWAAGRSQAGSEKSRLVEACGARYVSTREGALRDLAREVGGFDVVIEAAGDAQLMLDALGLLGRNGVACLLGLDGRSQTVELDGPVIGVDAILQNRAIFGSVNCHRTDWEDAAERLDAARRRWPDALHEFVGLRVPVDRFQDAFAFRGIKATLGFS
jgi:glucose 1-dehydrogenase